MTSAATRGDDRQAGTREPARWPSALLGLVYLGAGAVAFAFVLLDPQAAVRIVGIAVLAAGVSQLGHAALARNPSFLPFTAAIGLCSVLTAGALLFGGVAASAGWAIGGMLLISGLVRLVLAWRSMHVYGWMLVLSGAVAVLAACVLHAALSAGGAAAIGVILAIDLLFHGAWWLALGTD